jgi:uncharacterized protein (DUF302 family)
MKTMTLGILIGLIAGILIGWLMMYIAAPKLLFKESISPLGFEDTVTKIEETVTGMGWKVPVVHDLQATMKKFDKEVRSVKVFEICHPEHSYEILSRNRERIVSSMMPCRIAVYESMDGSVRISRMNSGVVAKPMTKVVRKTMSAAARDVEVIIADVLKK